MQHVDAANAETAEADRIPKRDANLRLSRLIGLGLRMCRFQRALGHQVSFALGGAHSLC